MAREKERELAELERAARTVFAYNLNVKADERDLFEFFSVAGQVVDIRLIMDKNTKRSKGLAYVELATQEGVFNAVALTGQMLLGQAVMVKASEAEKNLAWEAAQAAKQAGLTLPTGAAASGAAAPAAPPALAAAPPPAPATVPCKLQVSNLPAELAEQDLAQIFGPFGPLAGVEIVRDAVGRPTGVAYVTFVSTPDASNALAHWNGRQLATFALSVQVVPLNQPAMALPGPPPGAPPPLAAPPTAAPAPQ